MPVVTLVLKKKLLHAGGLWLELIHQGQHILVDFQQTFLKRNPCRRGNRAISQRTKPALPIFYRSIPHDRIARVDSQYDHLPAAFPA